MSTPSPSLERLAERLAILKARYGYSLLDTEDVAGFIAQPGASLILFADDPAKVPESWDLTIILPEVVAKLDEEVRVGMLSPADARSLATRYGIRIWPALLALRDGEYLGAVEGLKDWGVYGRLIPELLAASPSRPPSIGIPVQNGNAATCH